MKKNVSEKLKKWYQQNKRSLPWRGISDPYKVWLSEIILQQTRVDQGMSYYLKFIEHFPTVKHLADAKEDEVLKLWQGLGYYSRARNLHAAAKQIGDRKKGIGDRGKFPDTYDEIIKLKGVGPYTAAAISSICFNEARAVVDGNVYRFISRLFGIKSPIDSTEGKKEFQLMADELLDKKNAGEHNQAMMEFGARHCKPQQPLCDECPFEEICVARRKNIVNELPVKEKKTKVRTRHFHYFVFDFKGKTFLKKRENEKDIWRNLFEFPVIEMSAEKRKSSSGKLGRHAINGGGNLKSVFGLNKKDFTIKNISAEHKHVLSHQILLAKFYEVELKNVSAELKRNFLLVKKADVNKFALPRLIDKYFNKK